MQTSARVVDVKADCARRVLLSSGSRGRSVRRPTRL